ncbi:unnamed protein product [Phytomonas sp. EM1]|nr:unnamed protein product [Phytomonas sp. EM1]|eukprot:CCW62505.1 unnamed protein product [Phytomonas sp. isolate EM1]
MLRRGNGLLVSFFSRISFKPTLSDNSDPQRQQVHDGLYKFVLDYDHKAPVYDSHPIGVKSDFFAKRFFSGSVLAAFASFASTSLVLYTFVFLVGSSIMESYRKLWFEEPSEEVDEEDPSLLLENSDIMAFEEEE